MKLSPERRALLERSASRYEEHVDLAGSYLAARGLARATALSFRLGVVDEPLPGDEAARGRLAIPYLTRAGVVSIRYRCLGRHDGDCDGHAKYWGYPGVESRLFNVGALFGDGDLVCITEGELDALVLSQCGLPAVGVPGVSNWKPHYSRIFEDFSRVFVYADGDDAGRKFGEKVASAVQNVTVIAMPDGMDVNDVLLHGSYGSQWLTSRAGG